MFRFSPPKNKKGMQSPVAQVPKKGVNTDIFSAQSTCGRLSQNGRTALSAEGPKEWFNFIVCPRKTKPFEKSCKPESILLRKRKFFNLVFR
jgi:hypothetical protein